MNEQDAASDTTNHKTPKVPVPSWIVLAGVALLLLSMVIFFLFYSADDEGVFEKQGALEETKISLEHAAENETIETTKKESSSIPTIEASLIQSQPVSSNPSIKWIEKLEAADVKQMQLQDQLNHMMTDNNARQDRQDALIKDLLNQLTAQSLKIEQLQSNIKARQVAVKTRKKSTPYKRVRIPLTLVSVDQWGNDWYAVVRSQGQLYELSYGQGIQGWYVNAIDRGRGAVTFKNKQGIRQELVIQTSIL